MAGFILVVTSYADHAGHLWTIDCYAHKFFLLYLLSCERKLLSIDGKKQKKNKELIPLWHILSEDELIYRQVR
jgi:hypothetical protein